MESISTEEFFRRRRSAEELRRLKDEASAVRDAVEAARPRPNTVYAELNPAARQRTRASKKRQREIKRESERRRMHDPEYRKERLEYQRRYREEHPERVRASQQRWRAKDPHRAREISRRHSRESRDRNAETVRAKQRSAAAKRREENPDGYKAWYEANLERERERGREAARLRSRLKALGLPPRKVHRTYANEKREHAAAADDFFTRTRRRPSVAAMAKHEGADVRHRTPEAVLALRHRAETARRVREFADGPARLSAQIDRHLNYAPLRSTIASEVRMDSRARELRGARPYDESAEVRHRIAAIVPPGILDARLLAQHVTTRMWWKQHSPQEIRDVFSWAGAHREVSSEHAAVHREIGTRVASLAQQWKSVRRATPDQTATGPIADQMPHSARSIGR